MQRTVGADPEGPTADPTVHSSVVEVPGYPGRFLVPTSCDKKHTSLSRGTGSRTYRNLPMLVPYL